MSDDAPGQPFASLTPFPVPPNGCGCASCWEENPPGPNGVMHVCGTCGNKRCPRATHHAHYCTGSNESGQLGSSYGIVPDVPTAEQAAFADELRRRVAEIRGRAQEER